MRILLAALLGAIAIFLWEFVAHMFTPLGEAGLDYMPRPDAVSSSLESAIGNKAGMYMFPTGGLTRDASRAEREKAMQRMMEEMKTKPGGLLIYRPAGIPFNFGKSLGVQFILDFVKALVAAALLAQTALMSYGRRVGFVVLAGVLAAVVTHVAYWNWYGFNGTYTASQIVMELVGFFFAGLVIAWLYRPAAAATV